MAITLHKTIFVNDLVTLNNRSIAVKWAIKGLRSITMGGGELLGITQMHIEGKGTVDTCIIQAQLSLGFNLLKLIENWGLQNYLTNCLFIF